MSTDFNKVLYIGRQMVDGRAERVYIRVEFAAGELSLTGVVGPRKNGNCAGGCGQIILSDAPLCDGGFAPGWSIPSVRKLRGVWERWHLNHMRPECEHQRAAGWLETDGERVKLYDWCLVPGIYKERREIERRSLAALKAGEAVSLTGEEQALLALPSTVTTHEEQPPQPWDYYELDNHAGIRPAVTVKALGWLKESEHPRGILSKPCPECGYKYGSSWLKEEVPADVLAWLEGLPECAAADAPAWV